MSSRQQKPEQLGALATTALEHVSTGKHFARHFPELARAEIETPVELRDGLEDLLMGKARIPQCAPLHAGIPDQPATILAQPAILCGLTMQEGARICGRQRDLNGVRIHFLSKFDRLLNCLFSLAGQANYESPMNGDAELMAVLGELPRMVEPHALLDIDENVAVAGLVAVHKYPEPVILEDLQRLVRDISLGVAGPGHADLPHAVGDHLRAFEIVGEG